MTLRDKKKQDEDCTPHDCHPRNGPENICKKIKRMENLWKNTDLSNNKII